MASGKDFPPPSEGRGFIEWCSDLIPSKKIKEKTKSQELFAKSASTSEFSPIPEKKISKAAGFFRTLDFLHIFRKPESYVIEVAALDLPLRAEKKALNWLHRQYDANIQDTKNALFFEPWQRNVYVDSEFQTLANQFSQAIQRASGDEVLIRQVCLSTLKSVIEIAQKHYQKPIAADDLQPLAMLLLLKADNPKLLTRDFLRQLQALTGENRSKVLNEWRHCVTPENIPQAMSALRDCGLVHAATELGKFVQAYDHEKIDELFSEELEVCSGEVGYSLMQFILPVKLFSDYAATFQQSKASLLPQRSNLSKIGEKIDFLHLFHKPALPSDIHKFYLNKSATIEQLSSFSADAKEIAQSPLFIELIERLQNVSIKTYEERFFVMKYMSDELAACMPAEKCQDRDLKNEVIRLLLVQAKNSNLLSEAFEKNLENDRMHIPDADSDLKHDNLALVDCIHKQRELLTIQSAIQKSRKV